MKTVNLSNRRNVRRIGARAQTADLRHQVPKIRNVLVPIDFSSASLGALEFALPLLKKLRTNLDLVHVFEPNYSLTSMLAVPLIVSESQVGKRIRRHLKDVAKKLGIDLRSENVHALPGRPFEEICRLARQRSIDLIVTATRGNTGLKHLVLGSTAERVVRYSPCPVLVVRVDDRKRSTGGNGASRLALRIKKILVPIDFSDCSMKGLAYAKGLAKRLDASLVLINSVHVQYYVTSDEYARYDLPLLMQEAEKASREQMHDLVQKADWEGIKVEASLQIGHPGDQICVQAKNLRADLIVTSTHGTTGLKHVLLGSTAEYVVRHALIPVLVVPSHDRPVLTSGKK